MDLLENRINTVQTNRHPWEEARYDFFIAKISKFVNLNSPICIYDLGCGDAYFITKLCNQFPNITGVGIDINFNTDDLGILQKQSLHNNVALFKSVDDAYQAYPNAKLILLMDVIEHIEDDKGFLLSLVCPIVKQNDALVYITVPAFQSLFTQHDVFLKHYRRYDNKMLSDTTNAVGLKTLDMGYFFFSLLPLRVLEMVKNKLSSNKKAEGLANWDKGTTITNLIKNILVIDYKISILLRKIGIKIPGLSNYTICKF
jgi:trans-aconitate methyltransferase